MSKLKALHEFQNPFQCLSPESFLDYVNGIIAQDHLCRLVKEIVWTLDTVSNGISKRLKQKVKSLDLIYKSIIITSAYLAIMKKNSPLSSPFG